MRSRSSSSGCGRGKRGAGHKRGGINHEFTEVRRRRCRSGALWPRGCGGAPGRGRVRSGLRRADVLLAGPHAARDVPAESVGRLAHRAPEVAVVGGGQSALESAALLCENGAEVELIMRTPQLHWVGRAPRRGLVGRLLFDRTDVGPAFVSHVVARPTLVRRLPVRTQRYMTRRALVAGGALWLRHRISDVNVTTGRRITAATRVNGHLALALDDGAMREVDHALLATGYKVDVRRYEFLGGELLRGLQTVDGQPVLRTGLESSIPGLHFIGAPAVRSFGPLLRFVAGTGFAAGALVRSITGKAAEVRRGSQAAPGLLSERRTS